MNPHIQDPSSITAITPAKAVGLLKEVYEQLDAQTDLKSSVLAKLTRSDPFVGALAFATLGEVEDLLSDLRCVRGCALKADALKAAVKRKRPQLDIFASDMDADVFESLDKRMSADGELLAVLGSQLNVKRVLMGDPVWSGRIKRNTFAMQTEIDGESKTDIGETSLHLWLDEVYRLNVPANKIGETLDFVGSTAEYHPVREYLEALEWDRLPRLERWLIDYCGSPDKKIVRAYAKRWAISAVARVMEPGCKVDTTLILQGEQGTRKSTAFRALCHDPKWFSDSAIDIGNKDAMAALQGVWIYEFPELSTFKRSDTNASKAFLASAVDRFRPAYGRNMVRLPRQCVICGSTNETNFLKDPTGSRRYWPVEVGTIALAGLGEARDQLWAEAFALYRGYAEAKAVAIAEGRSWRKDPGVMAGQWWLTPEEEIRRRASAHLFTEEDHLLNHIAVWLVTQKKQVVAVTEIEAAPVHRLGVRLNSTTRSRIYEILKTLGYERMPRGRLGRRWSIKTLEWDELKDVFPAPPL